MFISYYRIFIWRYGNVQSLNPSNSPGPDSIPYRPLKEVALLISDLVTIIFDRIVI